MGRHFCHPRGPGGYKLINHLGDVENSEANPLLRQLLVTGSETARSRDLIVIQEQSQIPGFGRQSAENVDRGLETNLKNLCELCSQYSERY